MEGPPAVGRKAGADNLITLLACLINMHSLLPEFGALSKPKQHAHHEMIRRAGWGNVRS